MAILPAQAAPFSERALQRAPKIRHPNRPPCTKPSKTLYIRNLNEKIKPPVLKSALEALFETYGEVLEVRVRTSVRMRGQAFIAFKQEGDAARAHSEVQGFALFEKPMFIEFARVPSDATVANEGGDVEEHKRRRIDEREKREEELEQQRRQPRADAPQLSTAELPNKILSELSTAELPNKILFLQGLPADIGAPEIEGAFKMFPGFVEVRWVSVKPDVAFVEFEADFQSGAAKASLGSQWSPRPDQPPVSVSFAKH
ncbi:hypothetical protein GQ54DRAFT_261774 [Martensiomyces pterosporus]|nr:hypothetical protein GQ54DRAFT_261774 [Martensiomyces pterosporus]